jgi:type II secretory pathway pseudopilin PulG
MKGQTLIEVVVVIALVVVLVTGIVSGTTVTLSQNKESQLRSNALQYAREGLEIIRYTREQGWGTFAALGDPPATYCLGSDRQFIASTGNCGTNILGTTFSREVDMSLIAIENAAPSMLIVVTVGWGSDEVFLSQTFLKIE